jgi:galactokinase
MMDIDLLRKEFQRSFSGNPRIFRAPGRVNLIGEHTDYNDGFVMPAAIEFSTWVAIAARSDSRINLQSDAFSDTISIDLNERLKPAHWWSDFVIGVVEQMRSAGMHLRGADILIHGEVPMGAGLSSSAAIEVAAGFALLCASEQPVDRTQLALICQQAENQFVGTRCGIMDQFVSCQGKRDHALMLDCRSLEFSLLPLSREERMVICNTMVRHEHASGEYNPRREACEEGVRILQQWLPGIRSLRDVSMEQLEHHRTKLPDVIYRRCRHVVSENDRVERAAAMLEKHDMKGFGELMAQSHASLRDDYEVSCRELDIMVEIAIRQKGVLGARMTGGGFGGCTINLVETAQAEGFRDAVAREYEKATGLLFPQIYISPAADGVAEVT